MAVANLHETLLTYKLRLNKLNVDISNYQSQKANATYAQADVQTLKSAEARSIRNHYKELFEEDPELQEKYKDYTEIPDFEDEIDKMTAKFQDEFDRLTAWETVIDNQITTASAEIEEVTAYMESLKSMLSSNIQSDFDYSLK